MPLLDSTPDTGFDTLPARPAQERKPLNVSIPETINSAFRLENDVVSALNYLSRPAFTADKNFKLFDAISQSKYNSSDHRLKFAHVKSQDEFNDVAQRLEQELHDREVLAEAGGFGIAAGITAGVFSPTLAIPLGVAGTLVKGAAKGAALTAGAAILQEGTLYATQEARTKGELFAGIATGTILGGILGGAVGHMSGRQMAKASFDMANPHSQEAIPVAGAFSTSGHSTQLLPVNGTYRYTSAAGEKVEFRPKQLLVVTPDSLPIIAKSVKGKVTHTAIRKFAKDNGYDSIFIDAFDTRVKGFHGTKADIKGGLEPRLPKATKAGQEPSAISFTPTAKAAQKFGDNIVEELIDTAEFKNITARVDELVKAQKISRQAAKVKAIDELGDDVPGIVLDGKQAEISSFKANKVLTKDELLPEGLEILDKSIIRIVDDLPPDSPFPKFGSGIQVMDDEVAGSLGLGTGGGAQATRAPSAGELKDALPGSQTIVNQLIKTSPVARTINQQTFPLAQWMMAQLSTGGMRLKKNYIGIASAEGGTIEHRVHTHYNGMLKAYEVRNLAYADYLYDGKIPFGGTGLRAQIKGTLENGKLSKKQFNEEISHAMRNGDDHELSAIRESAKAFREHIYNPALKEMTELEMFPKTAGDIFDISYLNRMYDIPALEANPHGFIKLIADSYEEQMQKVFARALKQKNEADELAGDFTSDLQLTKVDAENTIEDLRRRLKEVTDDAPASIKEVEEEVKALRAQARGALTKQDAQDLRAKAKELEKSAGKPLAKIKKERRIITKRLENFSAFGTKTQNNVKVKDIADLKLTRNTDFLEKMRDKGFDDIDLEAGTMAVREVAEENAREILEIILKTNSRLPALDIMQSARGPELARTLAIESNKLSAGGFLINDADMLSAAYLRTVSSDIEMMKKFGTVSGGNILKQISEQRLDLTKGLDNVKDAKKIAKITKTFKSVQEDLEAVISRVRHTRGLPENPHGMSARLMDAAKKVNVLRYMGMVTVSSIPDVGRPIAKYGLTRVFKDGFVPLITNFKTLKLVGRELKLAGGALDVFLHTRAQAVFDLGDEVGRRSKFEQGLDFATGKMGLIAGFDYWTTAMKQFTGVVANARLIDSVEMVVKNTGGKDLGQAKEFLAAAGINPQLAHRIWSEVSSVKGGGKVNGIWLPNTEAWADQEARTAYRAALVGEVDNTIITPGHERALIADAAPINKLILQFKSFAMSSTTKTTIAGLQQRDMAFLQGAMISLAFGALSYYLWANAVGGKAKKEMESAGPGKWADEAYARAGLDGSLRFLHDALEKIPALNDADNAARVTFSGTRNARKGNDDLFQSLLGPSADLAKSSVQFLTGLHEPTASTLHKARTIMPLQNHLLLRQLFTKVEDETADYFNIPERR